MTELGLTLARNHFAFKSSQLAIPSLEFDANYVD